MRKCRLIWVFTRHTCHFVGFVMQQLKGTCHNYFEETKAPKQTSKEGQIFWALCTGECFCWENVDKGYKLCLWQRNLWFYRYRNFLYCQIFEVICPARGCSRTSAHLCVWAWNSYAFFFPVYTTVPPKICFVWDINEALPWGEPVPLK